MKIQGRTITIKTNYLDRVTYVPSHVYGNASHKDCEPGVIVRIGADMVFVLYCKGRNIQATNPKDLVWG